MFKISLENAGLFKNAMGIIAEMIDEGLFKIDSNGLSLLSPDRNMIVVVDFKLLSTAFEEYTVEKPVELGLNLINLYSVLKRVRDSDKITLQSPKEGKLELIVEGDGKRRFEVPLLDIKQEKPPVDQLKFNGKIGLSSSVLEAGIADADVVSDSVVFEANPNNFKMWAKGDISSSELEMKKGDSPLTTLEIPSDARARYPLEYLKKIIKASKMSDKVHLEFGTDYPLRLSFKVPDKISFKCVLAPRVED